MATLEALKAHGNLVTKTDKPHFLAAFLLAAYIAGHMVQAIASAIDDTTLRTPEKRAVALVYKDDASFRASLSTALKKQFQTDNPGDLFKFCETYVRNITLIPTLRCSWPIAGCFEA